MAEILQEHYYAGIHRIFSIWTDRNIVRSRHELFEAINLKEEVPIDAKGMYNIVAVAKISDLGE